MSPLPLNFERSTPPPHLLTRVSGKEAPIEALSLQPEELGKGAQRGGLQEGAPECVCMCVSGGRQAWSRGFELRPEPLPRNQTKCVACARDGGWVGAGARGQ